MTERAAYLIKGVAFASLYILVYTVMQVAMGSAVTLADEDVINMSGLILLVATLASYLIYRVSFYIREIDVRDEYRIAKIEPVGVVFVSLMAIGFRLVTIAYFDIAQNIDILERSIEQAQDYNFDTMTPVAILLLEISACVIGPIFEEILFRGIAFKELSRVMPVYVAIVLQGIFFGIAHGVLVQSIFAAALGIILGYIYYKTNNLKVTIIAHIVFNISAVLQIYEGVSMVMIALIGVAITILSVAVLASLYKNKPMP